MTENERTSKNNDEDLLAAELEVLQSRLKEALKGEATLCQAYDAECRSSASDDAKLVVTKQRLDVAVSRITGIRAEIGQKQRLLDNIQGCEAEQNRQRKLEQDFETAGQILAEAQAELTLLKAEFQQMPDRIRAAEARFHRALRGFNEAKEAKAHTIGDLV